MILFDPMNTPRPTMDNFGFRGLPCYYVWLMSAPDPKSPLSRLDRQELLWLIGILKDACRERLEKNLVTQAFEEKLHKRGPVPGRLDPRPFLKIWEPRYRKFLEVATELHAQIEAEEARVTAEKLARRGPLSSQVMIEGNAANSRRKSRPR
jgi:hypothetical protein